VDGAEVKLHENVRASVITLLRDLLKEVVEEKYWLTKDPHSLLLMRLLGSEEITLLMPQEVYVGSERKSVDMTLGNTIVFEFKSSEREFAEAEESARTKYWHVVSRARYYIVTNWDRWRIYSVTKDGLGLEMEGGREEARKRLRLIISQLEEIKIPPLPGNVEALYKLDYEEKFHKYLREAFEKVKEHPNIKPLYEAYRSIMSMLYGATNEELFIDLFIRHTYMQLAVMASLSATLGKSGKHEELASGSLINVDIALPYLNWWRQARRYNDDARKLIDEVLEEVVDRTYMISWSSGVAEDVFRMLYEFLMEPTVRRRLGEYYTPLWLVEMMLNEFGNIRGKIILDPFCGSGTFLVTAFHRKVNLGESPDDAYNEVVGFDVNPLAVAVARAELIIAYWRRTQKEPENPPHIYHIDTFAIWFGGGSILIPGLNEVASKARSFLQTLINFGFINLGGTRDILVLLRDIEKSLTLAIRFAYKECGLRIDCLEKMIATYLEEQLKDYQHDFIQSFLDHIKNSSASGTIAKLIVNHGGNDVWGTVFMSIYAPILMTRFKPDIIITNPPWIPVTEYQAPYSDKIREYMFEKITMCIKDKKKAAQILTGADMASATLGESINLADEVAYIMNEDQLFNHRRSTPAGIVATYCILRNTLRGGNVKLYHFDFDVFQHGIKPAVIIIKRGGAS
jgi:hypothetical protein